MSQPLPRLSRYHGHGRPPAPVRIAHLGLGNFFRAHQAWYTEHAGDAAEWGIAAFTGRRPDAARALAPQDGLYTLVVRTAEADDVEVIGSVSAVHAAEDNPAWLDYLRSEETAVVTLTVTEAGYRRAGEHLDLDHPDVRADIEALREDPTAPARTTPGRLVAGLIARRAAEGGPLTILSCDNLPGNGEVVATVVRELAEQVEPSLLPWLDSDVDFATSMVDRITPATTDEERATVREHLGLEDASPVPTEPFTEWVIQGRFPAGRPRWEDAGAVLVDDVAPYERRKLFLLNGSHSLLAYAGSIRGHQSVADAIADPTCRAWVEAWWDEAAAHVGLPEADIAAYRAALLERYGNPRIQHLLAQIAKDGSQKLPVRVLPTLRAERAAGRMPSAAVVAVAAWIAHLRGAGAPVGDVRAEEVVALARGERADAVRRVLAELAPDLGADAELATALTDQVAAFETAADA
ncbi:mannitol dehydrogenase family protein [Georgenia faecalis]|uniref:mannitol dehydrogenase family protein n=1 Tax=Georgenia faecalis TaxID=2483799 RepID=UPI000FDBAF30|nr:mannitol dehydrogenase family protein [Georgenia faecalis]